MCKTSHALFGVAHAPCFSNPNMQFMESPSQPEAMDGIPMDALGQKYAPCRVAAAPGRAVKGTKGRLALDF